MRSTVSIAMPHALKDGANAVTMCSPLKHKDMSLDTIWGIIGRKERKNLSQLAQNAVDVS